MSKWMSVVLCVGCSVDSVDDTVADIADNEVATGVYRLSGEAFDLPHDDLEPLSSILDGVDIVGVGESMHGSSGFHRTRARVMKKLIVEDGFRFIALEGFWQWGRSTQEYIETCDPDDLELGMAGLSFNVWMSPESAEFLQWVCTFNDAHPDDKVGFFSVDVQQPWYDVIGLKVRWEGSPALQSLDRCIGANLTIDDDPYEDPVIASIYQGPNPELAADTEACLQGIPVFREWLLTQPDNETSLLALISLAAGQQMINNSPWWVATAHEARDGGMADMLLASRELYRPGARTIYWAHNAHILTNALDVEESPVREVWRTTGTQLHERLGDRYAAIGFGAQTVSWDLEFQGAGQTRSSGPGSVETRLSRFEEPFLLVDTHAATAEDGLFDFEEALLFGNPAPSMLVPSHHFRALVYADESGPMELWDGFR